MNESQEETFPNPRNPGPFARHSHNWGILKEEFLGFTWFY
jgi:hypothetical protein